MTEFEEKMLQAVSDINGRLDSMEKRFDSRFDGMENRLGNLEKDMSDVKADIKSINITLETEVAPVLKMLLEYQLSNSKRLISLEKNVELMRDEMDINEVLSKLN